MCEYFEQLLRLDREGSHSYLKWWEYFYKEYRDLIRIPTSFIPSIKQVLFPKLFSVSVEGATDPTGIGCALRLTKDGVQVAHLQAETKLLRNKTKCSPPDLFLEDKLFLLGHSHSLALVSCGLGMLSSSSQAPVVSQTTVSTDLLQTLQVLSDLVVKDVRHHLVGLAVLVVPLPVQKPVRDLVLAGILKITC